MQNENNSNKNFPAHNYIYFSHFFETHWGQSIWTLFPADTPSLSLSSLSSRVDFGH